MISNNNSTNNSTNNNTNNNTIPTTEYQHIVLPTSISLMHQNCSSSYTATISPMTVSPVYVRIGTNSLSLYGMYLQDQSSNNVLFPLNSIVSQQFAICSYSNATIGLTSVPIDVVGDARVNYTTNIKAISVTISVSPPIPAVPTIMPLVFSESKATGSLTASKDGTLYWTFSQGIINTTSMMNFTSINNSLGNKSILTLESQSDFATYLYSTSRYLIIGKTASTTIQNSTLTFDNILPNTNYTLCSYLLDINGTVGNASCKSGESPADAWNISKAVFTFYSSQNASQRNALLCGIVDTVGLNSSSEKYIINRRSESCNRLGNYPLLAWYGYNGSTFDDRNQAIYLITTDNSALSEGERSHFRALFDSSGSLSVHNLLTINSKVNGTLRGGTYVGIYVGSSMYISYRDTIWSESDVLVATYGTNFTNLTIKDITTGNSSAVYYIVQPSNAR